jgi:hypothetical protein
MPQFIDSIYVHRPVDEADIPPRRAEPAPVPSPIETAMATQPLPSGPWSPVVRAPAARPTPGVRRERDLAPLFLIAFFAWIAISCVSEIIG